MKGYEMYSWQTGGEWHFSLMIGTNRIKTLEEITNGADSEIRSSVVGVTELKNLLSRLPANEEIFWAAQQFTAGSFTLPPQKTIDEIQSLCKQLGLVLSVGE